MFKLKCKKNYIYDGNITFIKNKMYDAYISNIYLFIINEDGMEDWFFYVVKNFNKKFYYRNYFYTEQELRKIKIEKLLSQT